MDALTETIRIRVTAADKARFEAAAASWPLTLSAWARATLLRATKPSRGESFIAPGSGIKVGDTITYSGHPGVGKIIAVSGPKRRARKK